MEWLMKTDNKGVPWQQNLQVKIGGALVLLTTLVLIGLGTFQYLMILSEYRAMLNATADSVIERLAENLAGPMWGFDDRQRDTVIFREMRDRTILYVAVVDPNGQLQVGKIRDGDWS